MADHLTEEEQIETIKRWWNDNWFSLVLPVLVAALAYTGWNYWNDYKLEQAQVASDKYQELLNLVDNLDSEDKSSAERTNAKALAQSIQDDYSGMYADLSSMILARFAVDEGDLDTAESALRSVSENGSNEPTQNVARARLAKVLLAKQQYDEALALVAPSDSEAVKSLYAEVRGDIYVAQGELAAANTAYQEAIDALSQSQMGHRGMLQFKLEGTREVTEDLADAEVPVAEDVAE